MSSLENHRWFVMRQNGHDGPFEQTEFNERIGSGDIEPSSLVWREGFLDWVPCVNRAEAQVASAEDAPLRGHLTSVDTELNEIKINFDRPSRAQSSALYESLVSMTAVDEAESKTAWLDISGGIAANGIAAQGIAARAMAPSLVGVSRQHFANLSRHYVSIVVFIAVCATAAGAYFTRVSFPDFADGLVSPQEKKMLMLARTAERSGPPRAAIAKALQGSFFYVASNARSKNGDHDGTPLKVRIDGVPRSLLGQIGFSVETTVTLQDGIAVTPELGKAAKGKYRVSVLDSETGSVLNSMTYFLGGSPDASYYKELEDFLRHVDAQAETERIETTQFVQTLQKLMSETTEQYAKLSPKMEKSKWNEFHASWARLFSQINSASKNWKSDSNVLRTRYLGLAALSDLVSKLHERQSLIIRTGIETDRDRNELAGILTSAESELRKLTGPES